MKKIDDIIFIDNLPSLDLHGIDSATSKVLIDDFIKENRFLKNEFVTIVHGIGTGILKNITKDTLSKNKYIIDFKIWPFNIGCTLAQIKLLKEFDKQK